MLNKLSIDQLSPFLKRLVHRSHPEVLEQGVRATAILEGETQIRLCIFHGLRPVILRGRPHLYLDQTPVDLVDQVDRPIAASPGFGDLVVDANQSEVVDVPQCLDDDLLAGHVRQDYATAAHVLKSPKVRTRPCDLLDDTLRIA